MRFRGAEHAHGVPVTSFRQSLRACWTPTPRCPLAPPLHRPSARAPGPGPSRDCGDTNARFRVWLIHAAVVKALHVRVTVPPLTAERYSFECTEHALLITRLPPPGRCEKCRREPWVQHASPLCVLFTWESDCGVARWFSLTFVRSFQIVFHGSLLNRGCGINAQRVPRPVGGGSLSGFVPPDPGRQVAAETARALAGRRCGPHGQCLSFGGAAWLRLLRRIIFFRGFTWA